MSDLLPLLGRMNLAVSAAIVLVLLVRLPLRRLCGPEAAYGLWSLVPLSAAAMLLPARIETVHAPRAAVAPAVDLAFAPPPALETAPTGGMPTATLLLALWFAGAATSLAWLAVRQAQFALAVRQGRAGPAVVGVLRPRIVAPADFAVRYSSREQALVLAHERAHLARHDSRINALAALGRCLAWFNPLAHLFVHVLRVDQELACDARVVAAHPGARRAYAEAMLKAQLAARPLPLGCYWPASAAHPLAQRVALLARKSPSRLRRRLGVAAVAGLGLALTASAWAARPTRLITVTAPLAVTMTPTAGPAPEAPAGSSAHEPRHAADAIATAAIDPAAATPTDPPVEDAVPPATAAPLDAPPQPEPVLDPGARYRPRVSGAARRTSVEPGSAVRVTASLTDPSGARLVTDLTSFGSQSLYRSGVISRPRDARYALFTSVVQQGDLYLVTASLGSRFAPPATGAVRLAAGESGRIYLPNGMPVEVSVTARPETAEEAENGRLAVERDASARLRNREIAWEPFQCGRRGAVC